MTHAARLLPLALLACSTALAAPNPVAAPLPPPIPAPAAAIRAGEITLAVDATDTRHHVFDVRETIPATPGPMTLLFPKWIPGEHGPTGPLAALAGLTLTAGGKRIAWTRDPVEMFAFHIDVPAGATEIEARFQHLSPTTSREGQVVMSESLAELKWNAVVLYPAGTEAGGITIRPRVKLPAGWHFATALDRAGGADNAPEFEPVNLHKLIDSPLLAGKHFTTIDLNPGENATVRLNIASDRPEDATIDPKDLEAHRELVRQATRNFGSHHYRHYDFLFWLSDELDGEGLEHHQSSEDGVGRLYFTDRERTLADRDLLPHEFTHSWNGKFRRPADLYAADYTVMPERDSLLWVYEGQTEYWGQVLAARSGLITEAQYRDLLAYCAAQEAAVSGRAWRPLQDTTNDPILHHRRPVPWYDYKRGEDYYVEGMLIWLDADTLIRERTNNARSLTSFAQKFFGAEDGRITPLTYTFDDVVAGLKAESPEDWQHFLRSRLDRTGGGAPLDGLARAGWNLVFTKEKTGIIRSMESLYKNASFEFSLGFVLGEENTLARVAWGSPAFKAGLAKGLKIIAVNGLAMEGGEDLERALKLAAPIELLVQDGRHFRTVRIDYRGGPRYPHLERIAATPDRLHDIVQPLK